MRLLASGQTTVADTTDGYSVVLSPNNYTFQGTTDSVSGTQSVTATVTAHRGEDAVTADINASSITVPSGFTVTNVGTSPSATITITANNTVTSNGGFTVPVVVHDGTDNINFNLKFSYSIAFTGSDGRGVSSITDQYCLSTSQSSAIGNWVNELPPYQTGRYYWTRQHIVYSDGSDEYTDAVYDGALTTANGNAYDAAQAAAAAQTQAGRAETAANNAVASAGRAETAATTAETNAAQAIQDAADAKTAATSAQADAADAKTAAQNAQSDAADAATAAQAAQGSAATAASSASAAQTSAQNAEASAQSAQDDADAASTSASQAATSAQNAISSAQAAETAANEAKADAADAKTAAGEAKREAATATRAANGALTQLSTVEDVVDVLNWIQQHGTYTKSTDTEIVAGKYYFTRSGTSPNYNYTLVNNPTGNPSTNNYYECTGVDEAVTNYVTTHLALTNDGLYVVKDNQGYKLKLGADGAYVIDPTGQVVATYGESIFFDSDRPQRIGNNNVYLEYYDSDNDTVADALRIVGANITLQSGQTVEQSVGAVQSDLDSYKQTNNAAVQGNATDLANYISSNNSALEVLQTQIDGAIETWFYEVDPTTSNPPASSWNTDDKKKTHLGDLYYNTATGHVFRWQKSGSTYSWTEIQDVDATKALADAAKAQTTANNKRRVFVTTPTPPYDVGDLWVGGSNGDIKRCATAKADGQSYAAGDWVLASKYTDDTKANAIETALNNYKTTVSNTYVANTTFETRAESIEGQVSSVETTTKAYADGLIEQEVTNRNAAITAKATEITTQVSETYQSIDGMSDYATKTLLTQTANGINTEVAKKVGNDEVISRINQSAESVTIDAAKININGVITAGSIAKTADLPTKVSDLTNDSNYQTASDVTTTLSPYAKTADISSTYATKSTANLREQRIYITKASGTNSVSANTTWVTSTSDSQNAWTTKRPTYNRDYPVLFTAIQSQTVSQSGGTTCSCTTPVKDDTLTIIDGGHIITGSIDADKIAANAITANKLATDAIKSNNYQASQNASSPYSATGTFLDLSNGRLYMPNFGVDADGKAFINGEIIATSGKIGEDATSYWEIGTQTDYNNKDSAALIGHGTSFIQTGDFQLSNGLLNTRSYTANHQITYPKYNNTYWDFGVQAPTLDTTTSSYIAGIDDNFFYIRNHANTIPQLKQDWNYLYRVDKNGNIYTTGQLYINGQSLDQLYASISDVDSSFLPTTGGTINGNLTVTGSINGTATKATQLTHTLSINNKTWDGSANTDVGTIGVAYGGTGGTTFTSGAALIGNGQGAFQTRAIRNNTSQGALGWTSSSVDNTLITTNTLAYWNGAYQNTTSNIEYVKQGKLGTVVTHDLEDFITTEGGIIDGALAVTDLNAGSLVVTGAARFTNAIYGDLTGNADTADKVNHDLIIKLNSGTTEGTNMFTFNGSAAKTVNVTKSAIGLGNVENTTLSTWAGSANLTTTKVGTLAAAAAKGVDSSIAAASTSGNLPTSAAVATFVEGKGYVTSSGVTSVRVQATSPVVSSVNTAQTATLNTTISLADGYGDTKNPYASKTKNYVLAAPSDANGAPTFRALVADDIPTLTPSKVGLGNVTNNKQVKGLSSGTTNGHLVTWGADGYTVADSGIVANNVKKTVTTLASNNDGKLVLTYLDGTTSDPIEVKIIGSSGSSVSYADALNVGGTAVGSASKPVFINAQGKPQAANTIPTVTLNGSATTSASFYAPTTVGSNGQYLKSNGSGAPTWATFSKSTVGLGNVDNTADADKSVKSATKATQDSDGNAINTTYLKRSGGVLTIADGVSITAPVGTVIKPNADSIIQSPIPKYLWHDVWGFCKATTPKYYTTTDGTTWTEATLDKRLFAHMENCVGYNIIEVDGKSGSRWEWDGGRFGYCSGAWLVIGVKYSATMAKFNVLLEQSSGTGESAEWETLCESNNISANSVPIWIKTNGSNKDNIRLTITRNAASSTSTNLPIVALRWLTLRWGDQGKGSEFEYPYSWDSEGNMTAKGTFTGTFNGTFNGNATTATSAIKATQDGSGNTITSTYLKRDGSNTMTGTLNIIPPTGEGGEIRLDASTAETTKSGIVIDNYYGAFRIFGGKSRDGTTVTDIGTPLVIDPHAKTIKGDYTITGTLSGNAATATKATQDGFGNTITSTYVNLTSEQTISGIKTFSAMPVASAGLCVGNSGTAGGLSLWSDKDVKRYGLALRLTSDSGKHGYVQGDYATYNYMYAASDTGVYTRGWIFKDSVHDKGVASISGAGNAVFNGSVTVGGNAANTSGWRLEKDEDLDCLNFIFVA